MTPTRIVLSALLVLAPTVAAAQSKTVEQTVALGAGGHLTIKADISSLHLTSWDREQVQVVARISPTDSMSADYGRRAVEATTVEVSGDAGQVTVRADYSRVPTQGGFFGGDSRSLPHIDYEIRAPRRLRLSVDIDRSTADIEGFEGQLEFTSDRTRFRATDLAGDVRLDVDRAASVTLDNLRGSLRLDADRSPVTIGPFAIDGDSRLDVGRGTLDVRLPSDAGLTLSVDRERRSQFESDFPITTRQLGGDRIDGTINGGGPRLSIGTDRAQVRLRAE